MWRLGLARCGTEVGAGSLGGERPSGDHDEKGGWRCRALGPAGCLEMGDRSPRLLRPPEAHRPWVRLLAASGSSLTPFPWRLSCTPARLLSPPKGTVSPQLHKPCLLSFLPSLEATPEPLRARASSESILLPTNPFHNSVLTPTPRNVLPALGHAQQRSSPT